MSATAETVRLLSAPAELSREPSANADCAAAWSALELPESALNADALFAISPAAIWRLWNEDALLSSAENWPPFVASAENAEVSAPSADIAFVSDARLANAEAAPDIAGTLAALAASALNAGNCWRTC